MGISHQGQPSTPTSNIKELKMKLVIFIIALFGAALALPQEAPEEMSASLRQDKPNPAEARAASPQKPDLVRAASPQKPDIVSDRQSAKGCGNGPDPNRWCGSGNKYFCTANTSYKDYFYFNCKKMCGFCDDGCREKEFKCKSGRTFYGSSFTNLGISYSGGCMPVSWACDGAYDCDDGSDEDMNDGRVVAQCTMKG